MRINFSIELRRPARRSIALLLAVLLLAVPGVALASHQFPDVPTGHPFHGQISAIAEAGITAGFPDGGYHPSEPVTRQAMAAFMHRGFGRVAYELGPVLTDTIYVEAGQSEVLTWEPYVRVRIVVPGSGNAFTPTQAVLVRGHVAFRTPMSSYGTQGCPCEFSARILDEATNEVSLTWYATFDSSSATAFRYGFDVEGLFAAPPGERSYLVQINLQARNSSSYETYFSTATPSVSAMTFPFGLNGTSDLQ